MTDGDSGKAKITADDRISEEEDGHVIYSSARDGLIRGTHGVPPISFIISCIPSPRFLIGTWQRRSWCHDNSVMAFKL